MSLITTESLRESLERFVEEADHGARLPTVRELMRQYGVGQATVQRAVADLRRAGRVSATVGRGTYVVKLEAVPATQGPQRIDNLLILANSSMNERCTKVQNALVEQAKAQGGRVVQISYHDTEHLMDMLQTVPQFDAVVLQSHYESMPVRLLSLLQSKARAIVVDGLSVTGVDVDRMGIDWGDAMALAFDHLTQKGHDRIALVSLGTNSQPILIARRFFERIHNWNGRALQTISTVLKGPVHPSDSVSAALAQTLASLCTGADTAPTAVILLGMSDGGGVLSALNTLPQAPEVVLLGHTDVASEHMEQLTVAGGRSDAGSQELIRILRHRLQNPKSDPIVSYIPTELRV